MKKQSAKTSAPERRQKERRRLEEGLQPDFRDLTDNAVQGVLIHSNFKPLYANAACARLFGYDKPKDILELPLTRSLMPAESWAQAEEDYNALLHDKQRPAISRARGLRRDGAEIWLSVTERVIDWHGVPAVHLNLFDISKQVAVEQLMLDNEQLLRAMLEILPVPIYISRRRDGRMLFVNRKTCLLLQQSAGPLLRSKSTDFFVNQQDHDNLRALLDTLPDIREVEVKMHTAQGREFTAEMAAIVVDYGGEPASLVSLNDISQRKQMEAELFLQASIDSLTGISNRRYFLIQAEQELRRARRFSRDLSVMMIDLDHFKPINDRLGHAAGDDVLRGVVKAALESLRASDVMGRLGGEEFGVILPETSLAAAVDVANRLCQHIAERSIITVKDVLTCTASIGVAQLKAEDGSIDDLFQRADNAMYCAKQNGRNRVEIAA
jgi:diguanylate cyclase (GGDEF)-like protein/PAS domain S-box-containing protein